jgi:hypothetical protein
MKELAMRYLIVRTALIAAALMILAVPARADREDVFTPGAAPAQQGEKNECLLVARNCKDQADSYQERINNLQNEINRGTDVYTIDELKRLQEKLDDANRNLNELMIGS